MSATTLDSPTPTTLRPMRAFDVHVQAVTELSPHFRRITFRGADLALFGANAAGDTLDLRIKVMIPSPGQPHPVLRNEAGSLLEDWYQTWLAQDEATRGFMRTYTVRALRPAVPATATTAAVPAELDVDFVLHVAGGVSGPAAQWAADATPGERLLIVGPCALWGDCLGIEFVPGDADRVLLVGDETAVPAIAAILESLPAHLTGHAVFEVPTAADFLTLDTPSRVQQHWLAREDAAHGVALTERVRAVMASAEPVQASAVVSGTEPEDVNVDEVILWETPQQAPTHGLYAWIAGEAATIRGLRRYLVRDVGMDRNAVAFMGYWRLGHAL